MNARRNKAKKTPPPLAGLGREADQGWGEGSCVGSRGHHERPLPPTLVRFAAQARKGRGSFLVFCTTCTVYPDDAAGRAP